MKPHKVLAGALGLLVLGGSACLLPAAFAAFPVTVMVRQGDAVAGVGTVTQIDNLSISNAGAWIVEAETDADASSNQVMLRSTGLYLRENQLLAHPPGAAIASFDSVNLNAAGHSGWNGDHPGSTAFPVSSERIPAMRSAARSASTMHPAIRPLAYSSWARTTSTGIRSSRREARNGSRKWSA